MSEMWKRNLNEVNWALSLNHCICKWSMLNYFFSVGTFKIRLKEDVQKTIKAALDVGYRLIGQ